MYIDADTLITLAAVLTSLGAIGGVVLWLFKFVERNKKQDPQGSPAY